jgi:hypothetical protein
MTSRTDALTGILLVAVPAACGALAWTGAEGEATLKPERPRIIHVQGTPRVVTSRPECDDSDPAIEPSAAQAWPYTAGWK